MTGSTFAHHAHEDPTGREYFHHSSAQRVNTNAVLVEAIRKQYPSFDLVIAPLGALNLIAYANAGHAVATPLEDSVNDPVYSTALKWRRYAPPPRRLDNRPGAMVESVLFGKYLYNWNHQEIILYVANGRDGASAYPEVTHHYIVTKDAHKVDDLIKEATLWGSELHDEVWVFDQGYWQKSRELWESVRKSSWENVILEDGMKKAIIADVENFFDGQETYAKLKVPWKRGIIYYGPPGNGKTISIKAMMHALYQRGKSASDKRMTVPTLYVRSLASYGGPEYSLRVIFQKARETAPCYLVFEDLDSIVNDSVRSYFLNEVDGLKSNDGILMVGSTNHLDRLDPGISKRPSRFDRKYYFADPDFEQRVAYAKFWQGKLKSNEDLEFPDELCPAIAKITDKFSFAYMQEAFVASLLAIAVRGDKEDNVQVSQYSGPEDPMTAATRRAHFHRRLHKSEDSDPGLDKLVLWKEIQVQVKILKEEMDEKSGEKSALQDDLSASFCPRCNMSSTQHDAEEPPHAANERENKIKGASIVEKAAAAKPSLFTSFEQWKAAKSSRLPNSTVRSNPVSMPEWVQTSEERMVRGKSPVPSDDELKHMLESPIGMTPEFRTRMVLEDVERVRGEMLRYQISRSEVGTSMQPEQTAASPQQEAGLQTWPVARGGLPLTSNTADPTPSEQALREWSRLNNPRHEPVSASFTRESSEIPPSAEWLLCEQRLRMLDERKEFERKMEDIRAKIAMIE